MNVDFCFFTAFPKGSSKISLLSGLLMTNLVWRTISKTVLRRFTLSSVSVCDYEKPVSLWEVRNVFDLSVKES